MADHNEFGKEAERRAAVFLQEKGYKILKRNWRYLKMEIDIIARDPDTNQIVIVEVKARRGHPLVEPEDAVKADKKKLLVKAADQFITSNEIEEETRFDIISIHQFGNEWDINHIDDAFAAYE